MTNIQDELDKIKNTWGKIRQSDYHRIRRILVFKNGKLISSHLQQKEIFELHGVPLPSIETCLKGRIKRTREGYTFIYKDEWDGVIPNYVRNKKDKAKYLVQVFKDGLCIGEHIGYSEVISLYGIDPKTLSKIRKGRGQSSKGLTFKFILIEKKKKS